MFSFRVRTAGHVGVLGKAFRKKKREGGAWEQVPEGWKKTRQPSSVGSPQNEERREVLGKRMRGVEGMS